MAYIGTDINYGNIASMTGVGNGTTTPIATLDYNVPTSASIIVTLDGVTQVPTTDYTASGTTLTFTSSVASPIAILVVFLGRSLDIGTPSDNTVTNAKMANNAIDSAELVAGSVDLAHMSAESVDSDQYVDGSIDTIHIGNDQVTGAKLNPALVAGDIIYADGTDTINRLAKPATPAGEVLTFATSATAPSWVAPAGGGKLLAMETVVNSTRYALSNSVSWSSPLSATYTKQSATSDLIVLAFIAVHGGQYGAGSQGLYDGTTKYFSGWIYEGSGSHMGHQIAIANFGTLTTGAKTIQWGWESGNATTIRPADTVNPNSTDDARSGQNASTFIFCEVEA
jgi:hypothetical protein